MNFSNFYGQNSAFLTRSLVPIPQVAAALHQPVFPDANSPTFSVSASNFQNYIPSNPTLPANNCGVCSATQYHVPNRAFVCARCHAFFKRFVRKTRTGGLPAPCLTTKQRLPNPDRIFCNLNKSRNVCQPCRYVACLRVGLGPSAPPSRSRCSSTSETNSLGDANSPQAPQTPSPGPQNPPEDETLPHSVLLKRVEDSKPVEAKNMRHEQYNEQWKQAMGPFMRARHEFALNTAILGRQADQCLARQAPALKLEQQRIKESVAIAKKILNCKVPSRTGVRNRGRFKNQKQVEETVRNRPLMAYNDLQKVVSQNKLQLEINAINLQQPESKRESKETPSVPECQQDPPDFLQQPEPQQCPEPQNQPKPQVQMPNNNDPQPEFQNFVVEFSPDGHVVVQPTFTEQQQQPTAIAQDVNQLLDELLFPDMLSDLGTGNWTFETDHSELDSIMNAKLAHLDALDI